MMKIRTLLPFTALFVAVALSAQSQSPKLYKWVDKNGVTHYGSSIPPEYAGQQKEVLNAEGVVVQTLPGQKTPEELAREQREKAAAEQRARQEQQQRLSDRMLLDTYASVGEIERDRDSRLASLDAQINVTSSAITALQQQLAQYQQQAAQFKNGGRPLPPLLQKQLDDTSRQLLADQKLLLKQQQEKHDTRVRFASYIERYQQLTAAQNGGN